MSYYVYPDGTITEEPLSFMSDDYFIIQAEDYEEAYETALYLLFCIRAQVHKTSALLLVRNKEVL